MKKNKATGYPKTVELPKADLLKWSVNRIYKVTKEDAISISKEFRLPTDFQSTRDESESEFDFYYFHHDNGEFRAIFFLPRPK
jgi:hypothetical protein